MIVVPGATSISIDVLIVDDSGLEVTGLVAATFPTVKWSLAGNTAATSITLSDLSAITSAYSSGGLKERATGWYRLDLPNAALASAGEVRLQAGVTGKHLICEPILVGTAAIAASVWQDTVAGDFTVNGSPGKQLLALPLSAAIATAIWQDATPGDFTVANSAGYAIKNLPSSAAIIAGIQSAGQILFTLSQPLMVGGNLLIILGDDYYNADGRAPTWSSTAWPNLTGGSVAFHATNGTPITPITGVISVAGTGSQTVYVEISRTITSTLTPPGTGTWTYSMVATLADGHIVTLAQGSITTKAEP